MPYCAYGKIYYDPRETSYGYMEELAFAMQRAANDARIGINIQQNISEEAKKRCELQRIERRLCFELTDSPLDENAAYLFRPSGDGEELPAYKVARNEDFAYRMARVQTLLSKFLLFPSVDRIVLYVNPAYGVREQPCAIKAEAFCKTVVDFYNLGGVGAPSLAMTITA